MKLVRFLGAAGLALAAVPTLHAVPVDGTASTICLVNGGLNSCASVTASISGSVLTATVKNLGGDNDYTLTSLGSSSGEPRRPPPLRSLPPRRPTAERPGRMAPTSGCSIPVRRAAPCWASLAAVRARDAASRTAWLSTSRSR